MTTFGTQLTSIAFICDDPKLIVRCMLGDGVVTPSGGYGGWSETARPRRKSSVDFAGSGPFTQTIPVVLDGFSTGQAVNQAIEDLTRMATRNVEDHEPPKIRIEGPLFMTEGVTWVINDLSWSVIHRESSRRVQTYAADEGWGRWPILPQPLVITRAIGSVVILEKADDVILSPAQLHAIRHKPAKKQKAKHKYHVVKKGETLKSIAKAELGTSTRWEEIAKLNKIRDPKGIKTGAKLKMP